MDTFMKKATLLLLFALASVVPCLAQSNVTFGYDANGNRISSEITFKKSSVDGRSVEDFSNALTYVKDNILLTEVVMFPNPTKGEFSICIKRDDQRMAVRAMLSSPAGTILEEKTLTGDKETFDLSNQADGIYLLRISVGEEAHVWKVIKN